MLLSLSKTMSARGSIALRESVRSKHNMHKAAKRRRELNPGINLRAQVLKDVKTTNLEEVDFDDLESDFMNVGLSHKEHEKRLAQRRETEKHLIVGRKYFKEKAPPNFLTWSDKQQIRYLHNTDPENWTVEKLSEGFPALPETIEKIVRGNWTKTSSKIQNHDASVVSNWNLFKTGKLQDLPPGLAEHLNKFSERELNFEPFNLHEDEKPAGGENTSEQGEFSQIITSYKRLKDKCDDEDTQSGNVSVETEDGRRPKAETYLMESRENFKDKRYVTLSRLQADIEAKVIVGKDVSDEDRILLQQLKETSQVPIQADNPIVDISSIIQTRNSSLSTNVRVKKDYSHLVYPDKIVIPKDKYRRGYTYKLNDCFYDSDGLFLYRVPGMDK